MAASGVYNSDGELVDATSFDVGRVAIGQGGEEGQLLATPMQMAEVAAAVANGGDADEADLPPGGQGPGRPHDRGARPGDEQTR